MKSVTLPKRLWASSFHKRHTSLSQVWQLHFSLQQQELCVLGSTLLPNPWRGVANVFAIDIEFQINEAHIFY